MAALVLILLTLGVAYGNGSNDVSKGIATLVGSGVTDLRRALLWGAAWTVVGGILAGYASQGLVAVFSGKGLLVTSVSAGAFLTAIAIGAIGWLIMATLTGMPVSTTHALMGGLVGAALAAQGVRGVRWDAVIQKTALPLAISPLLSLALMVGVFPIIGLAFRRFNRYCVCVERAEPVVTAVGSTAALSQASALQVIAGADCPPAVVARVNAMDSLHWMSSGSTCLFRGMNDTPKILAIGAAAGAGAGIGAHWLFLLTALAMGAGSLVAGRRVTETLAGKVTHISADDGFAGNLVTSALVGLASFLTLPVSTTHVASGAILGIGLHRREVRWTVVRDIVIAWVVTLPVAGLIAAVAYLALKRLV